MGGSCTKEKNIKDSIYEINNLGVKINDKEPKIKRNSVPEEVIKIQISLNLFKLR